MTAPPVVGFIGLGDQGLPMAAAIAQGGYELHVWSRNPSGYDALGGAESARHATAADLAAACDVIGICISTDEATLSLVENDMLATLRRGTVVVNHGTGTVANARRLGEVCASAGVDVLDAPVSGGRPAAERHELATLVGGDAAVAQRCEAIFATFSKQVLYLGAAGAGQTAKIFNNALMAMNQANILEVLEAAQGFGVAAPRLVEAFAIGSANSAALGVLNTMITPDTVDHLADVLRLDVDILDAALTDQDVDADVVSRRARQGADSLAGLMRLLNP